MSVTQFSPLPVGRVGKYVGRMQLKIFYKINCALYDKIMQKKNPKADP